MKSKQKQKKKLKKIKSLVILEDHIEDCGFSSWIKETVDFSRRILIKSVNFKKNIIGKVGSQKFLENRYLF